MVILDVELMLNCTQLLNEIEFFAIFIEIFFGRVMQCLAKCEYKMMFLKLLYHVWLSYITDKRLQIGGSRTRFCLRI